MPAANRIASLDQFRGYTVAGMFLVNFVGSFAVTPILLTHKNNFCSYADTIMPQFFFAVGFAFRLTFGRRAESAGVASAYGHVVRRLLGLALVAIVIYAVPSVARTWRELVALGPAGALQAALKDWFQTLLHIAVTSLWILPVIRSRPAVRVAFALGSAALYFALSEWFYFDWVQGNGIDGGVLGFLVWTIPTIVGTLACDAMVSSPMPRQLVKLFAWSALLMLAGWLLSCGSSLYDIPTVESDSNPSKKWASDAVIPSADRLATHQLAWIEPPFVPPPTADAREENFWMMSQRAATLSYHTFAAGLSLALFGVFYAACDVWGWQLSLFRTLGTNALAAYILHGMVGLSTKAFMPNDSPAWYVVAGFLVYFGITYLFLRKLERDGIYLKL